MDVAHRSAEIAYSLTRARAISKGIRRIHLRIVIGGAILMVALLCWIFALDGTAYFTGPTR